MKFTVFFFLSLILVMVTSAEEKDFVYKDHGKRDPFWPLVSASGAPISYDADFSVSDVVVEGIMAEPGGNNFVVINGRIIKVNDRLGDYVVSDITDNSVILLKGEEKFELKLKKEE